MTGGAIDWEAEGLLDGLGPAARADRVVLLERLHEQGVPPASLRAAAREGSLAALPVVPMLGGPPRYSARDVAEANDLDLGFVLAIRRAAGVPVADPDERVLTALDLEIGRATARFAELGVTPEQIDAAARVIGRSLRQVAGQLGAIAFELATEEDLDELALSDRFGEQIERLQPLTELVVLGVLRTSVREAVRDAAIAAAERGAPGPAGTRRVAVAFADLVGFTRLGEELGPERLDEVARHLDVLVGDVVGPPVRFVKTVGDAAMLVSPDARALVLAALDLVEAGDRQGEDFPRLRVGVACGPAIARGGDWYGHPVNLASRVTAIARAGSVLCAREVHEAVPDAVRWSQAGLRRMHGVRRPLPLYRARRR